MKKKVTFYAGRNFKFKKGDFFFFLSYCKNDLFIFIWATFLKVNEKKREKERDKKRKRQSEKNKFDYIHSNL